MGLPGTRHSKSRGRLRRHHIKLKKPILSACSHCGQPKPSHHVCPNCGYYSGREIVAPKI